MTTPTTTGPLQASQHELDLVNIAEHSRRALTDAASSGSLADYNRTIETALKVHEHVGRELIRSRLRRYLMEAANVLAGTYEGQEIVLGDWAAGCDEETLPLRAKEFISLHKGMF